MLHQRGCPTAAAAVCAKRVVHIQLLVNGPWALPCQLACTSRSQSPPLCTHPHPLAQDKHSLELKVARQRVKHLLYEQGTAVARLKAEGKAALKVQASRGADHRRGCKDAVWAPRGGGGQRC